MEFPAGEPVSKNSSVWSNIPSRAPPLQAAGENGFLAAGFTSSSHPLGLCSRIRSRLSRAFGSLARCCSECLSSPVPGRVYGSSGDRFSGASAPAGGGNEAQAGEELVTVDRYAGASAPARDRFLGATAPYRPEERVSSNSDSPPYMPAPERRPSRTLSGCRDRAV